MPGKLILEMRLDTKRCSYTIFVKNWPKDGEESKLWSFGDKSNAENVLAGGLSFGYHHWGCPVEWQYRELEFQKLVEAYQADIAMGPFFPGQGKCTQCQEPNPYMDQDFLCTKCKLWNHIGG